MSLVSKQLRQSIRQCLIDYRPKGHSLLGIRDSSSFETFLLQLFDSVRRVEYVFMLRERDISPARSDPISDDFDPVRAALFYLQSDDLDEASWLVFLLTHFGKNARSGWQLIREVYGCRGTGSRWDWEHIRSNPKKILPWLSKNLDKLGGHFGNHRKYLSLKPQAKAGTGAAFVTYVDWVKQYSSHAQMLRVFEKNVGSDRGALFDALYKSMRRSVKSFGRMGCFDYLCMLGKLGIFPIEPSGPYIPGSTGPRDGATLLVSGSLNKKLASKNLELEMKQLGNELAAVGVRFAMQVLEDAICNWQKSPTRYIRFRG
jgi:hypothetical protein